MDVDGQIKLRDPLIVKVRWVRQHTSACVADTPHFLPSFIMHTPAHVLYRTVTNDHSDVSQLAIQIKTIQTLLQEFAETPVKEGETIYVVSRTWVAKALALSGDARYAKEAPSGPLGPVDNSDIIEAVLEQQQQQPNKQSFVQLKPGTGSNEFELFPKHAWELVLSWYGIKDGQTPITRTAVNSAEPGSPPNIMFEFHPPVFKIHRLWSNVSPIAIDSALKDKNPPPLLVARSSTYPWNEFLKEIKEQTDIPLDRRVRLWTVPRKLAAQDPSVPQVSYSTPPDSPGQQEDSNNPQDSWRNLLLDVTSFIQLERNADRMEVDGRDNTGNPNYNGKSSLSVFSLTTDQTLVIDEEIERDFWVSTYSPRGKAKEQAIVSRSAAGSTLMQTRSASSGRSSPAPQGPVTRGRAQQQKTGRSIGAVGLHNLGNTCYMNSALQCVRSVEELTKYFLTDEYAKEINKTNPLAFKGQVAIAYGELLKEIYEETRSAVSPRDFKHTVGKCRSTFSGWGQQDSQEFLGFLLDGLQEDLSRIKKKPYIEKPDSTDDMIGNPAAIREMAEKVWDITKKRDDSVIADLFTGMYKSTLKCPICHKISITFDPFNNLTLPLPVEDMWSKTVKFYPLNDRPVQFDVELPKHSAIELLKQFISERTGIPIDRLIGAEEWKDKFFKIYDDNSDISEEISQSDIPAIHELEAAPTNWPAKAEPRKVRSMLDIDAVDPEQNWEDPRYERMVVPVVHRKRTVGYTSYRAGKDDSVSPPHFIILNRREVCLPRFLKSLIPVACG
jgi:ubiquitin carboxyl-terminal hydrolase 4/11